MGLLTIVALGGGAVAGVLGAPVVLGAIGFTFAGIAAGSFGASGLSGFVTAAVASGGAGVGGTLLGLAALI